MRPWPSKSRHAAVEVSYTSDRAAQHGVGGVVQEEDPVRGLPFERRAAEHARRLWRRYGEIPKRWAIFLAVIALAVALDQRLNALVNLHLAGVTAKVTAGILKLLGADAAVRGTTVISSYCHFEIIGECTAYYPCAILVASILAYPTSWRRKLLGLGLGLPLLLLVNQGRLVSLCYIHRRPNFDFWHVMVWQSLIIFFTVMIWIGWVTTLAQRHEN